MQALAPFLSSLTSPATHLRWWRGPAVAALYAFGAAMAICILLFGTFYVLAVGDSADADSMPNPIQLMLVSFFEYHRVALSFETLGTETTFVFAPLGALLLIGIPLAVGGAFVGGNEPRFETRILVVVRYAVVYAVLSFFASFFTSIETPAGEGAPGELSVSAVGAFFMPLVWATLFGLVGAAFRAYRWRWVQPIATGLDRRVRGAGGAFTGAVTGLRTGLGLALLGMIVMVVLAFVEAAIDSPAGTSTSGSSDLTGDDARVLTLALVMLVLVLPNLVIATLLGSMGATLNASGSAVIGSNFSGSVGIFGASGDGAEAVDVPPYLLLLLVVPLIATVRAGYVAARHGAAGTGAPGNGPAMRAALGAGALMTVGCWLLAWICGGEASTPVGQASISVSPVASLILPPLWTLGGAWFGALVFLARQQQAQQSGTAGAFAVPGESYPAPTGQFPAAPAHPAQTGPAYPAPTSPAPYPAPTSPAAYAAPTSPAAYPPPAYPPPASPAAYPPPTSPAPAYSAPAYPGPAHPGHAQAAQADPWPASGPPMPTPDGTPHPCADCGTPNHMSNNYCDACGRLLARAA